MFVLTPFTGVLTDRYNRHRIMLLTQVFFMIQALFMAALVLFNLVQVWHIIALSLLFGIISAFDAPARQSLVIDLIDRPDNLSNAIALNSAVFNGARLIGPAIAGITIAIVGEGICFLINALSFVAVIYALLRMQLPSNPIVNKVVNLKKGFSEGLQYTFQSFPIRLLLLQLAILSLVGLPFVVLLPAYAKENLQGGAQTLGYLMSALGAGALTGALYLASRKTVIGLGRIISMHTVIFGLSVVAASYSRIPGLSIFVFFWAGLSMILTIGSINTLLQTIADDDKRGRVMSFYAMSLMGTMPIGNLLAGAVASGIGIPLGMMTGGIITVLLGIWFELNRKNLRKYIRPIYKSKGIIPSVAEELH
jgi:MFS family permease